MNELFKKGVIIEPPGMVTNKDARQTKYIHHVFKSILKKDFFDELSEIYKKCGQALKETK